MPKQTDRTEDHRANEVNGTGRDVSRRSFAMLEAASYADLRTKNGGAGIAFVRGHTHTGDGGEGLFYWKAGDTRSENHGTIIRPTEPSGNWIRIWDGPVNVKWFGECKSLTNDYCGIDNDGSDDDARVINAAIKSVGSGHVFIPGGVYHIKSTIVVENRRGFRVSGCAAGHAGTGKGTILRWERESAPGDSDPIVLKLSGIQQCVVEGLCIDGNNKVDTVGIHVLNGPEPSVLSQQNMFRDCTLTRCKAAGMKIGVTDCNAGCTDTSTVERFWIRENLRGVWFQQDQALGWNFYNCHFLANTEAGIETGAACPNRGGFNMFGGAMIDNKIHWKIPSVTQAILISGVSVEGSEGGELMLSHCSPTGEAKRTITLENVWQNSVGASYEGASIRFTTSNSLLVVGCRLLGFVELGNQGGGGQVVAHRTFINTTITPHKDKPDTTTRIVRLTDSPYQRAPHAIQQIGVTNIADLDPVKTLTADEETPTLPSVGDSFAVYKTANSQSTAISGFGYGRTGQRITVVVGDSNTTFRFNGITTLRGNGGEDWTSTPGAWLEAVFDGQFWLCTIHDA